MTLFFALLAYAALRSLQALARGDGDAEFVVPLFMFGFIILGLLVHTAYRVEYRIDNWTLSLRLGWLHSDDLLLDVVHGASTCSFAGGLEGLLSASLRYRRIMSYGPPTVVIETSEGRFWVRPTDPHEFIRELQRRLDHSRGLGGRT